MLSEVQRLRDINALYAKQRDEAEADRARLREDLAFARREQQQAVTAAQTFAQHNDRLKAALKYELDACFCDDRDGNCNPPAAPDCERCQRIRAALA